MTRVWIVLIAVCVFAAAATAAIPGTPRFRREIIEELAKQEADSESEICAYKTPCAWSLPTSSSVSDSKLTNIYCYCDSGLDCILDEFETSVKVYVYRCRKPGQENN